MIFHSLDAAKEDVVGSFKDRNPINIAKSLPMDIPAFMSSTQNHPQEETDDYLVGLAKNSTKFPEIFVVFSRKEKTL